MKLKREFEALGTFNTIHALVSSPAVIKCAEQALDAAVRRVLEIDDRMSAFKPDSDIGLLNQNAGLQPTVVYPETLCLLKTAQAISHLSDDAFDCTIHPLVQLWGIGKKKNCIPSQNDIEKTRKLVNQRDLLIDDRTGTVFLCKTGQAVDLGGIAKGYAADEVKRILTAGGIFCAMINLGGNIYAVGSHPDDSPWRIGIQNPTAPTGGFLGILSVKDKTIVTSGSNERFFIRNGIRYHHLLDPRTGKPAQSGLLSVTVVWDCSVEADALTTALFVLGIEKGMELLRQIKADAIFVTEHYDVYVTEGLKDHFILCTTPVSETCFPLCRTQM